MWPRLLGTLCVVVAVGMSRADESFSVRERADRLEIAWHGQPIAEYVFDDPRILRPYFAQVRTPSGLAVTRRHPPDTKLDVTDHDTMHPGIWLAFGDISGHDFWRNKGRIEQLRFTASPKLDGDPLSFATLSRLLTPAGESLGQVDQRFTLRPRPAGWRLDWEATFHAAERELTFGDQEEMGFGVRVATPLIEKNGGVITSSTGRQGASATWGQPAKWCDYSGGSGERRSGITLIPDTANFRECWWHNRDYGLSVANPFGRAALRQGERSQVVVRPGEPFRLRFTAVIHEGSGYDPAAEHQAIRGE